MPSKIPFARPPGQSAASTAAEYKRRPEYREAHAFYNSARWRKLRAMFLRSHPLCSDCEKAGRVVIATEVHHVKERRDHPELALDPSNLEGLCKSHHGSRRRGA